MENYKGKFKELAKNGKAFAIASAVVLTNFGIGYAVGRGMTEMKISVALRALMEAEPGLEEVFENAMKNVTKQMTE